MRIPEAAAFVRTGLLLLLIFPLLAVAHGERAQQANTRMRTINWYDVEFSPRAVQIGEEVRISGHFRTSAFWPPQIPSVEGQVFLNAGTAGPNFIRVSSTIDGVSMVQSTALELGRDYAFEMVLKARRPGRIHVHPVLSVKDAGGMVGPGRWIEVTGDPANFENEVTTMFGRAVDLETFNLGTIAAWHIIWFVIGGAWLAYWLRQRPLFIPRLRQVEAAEADSGDGDAVISGQDRRVAVAFLIGTLIVVAVGFQWAERMYPVTTPLRTARVTVPAKAAAEPLIEVQLQSARYRIPGRSFEMDLEVTNRTPKPLRLTEFSTANIRFINDRALTVQPEDSHDLVAPYGLRVDSDVLQPGETRRMQVYAEDALWETQRLVHMINDPDSIIAGLLFFDAEDGAREIVEIGGPMLPVFH